MNYKEGNKYISFNVGILRFFMTENAANYLTLNQHLIKDNLPYLRVVVISFQENRSMNLSRDLMTNFNGTKTLFIRDFNFDNNSTDAFYDFESLERFRIIRSKFMKDEIITNLLANMTSLTEFSLVNNVMNGNLPNNLFSTNPKLEKIVINNSSCKNIPQDIFHRLPQLKDVKLIACYMKKLSSQVFARNPLITKLTIERNNVTTISRDFFKFTRELDEINLSGNLFEKLPEDLFFDLTKLQMIQLSYNILKEIPSKIFSNCRMLKEVFLGGNSIEKIPQNLFTNNPKLEYLDLMDNNVKKIHFNFETLPKLRFLLLINNECISNFYFTDLGGFEAKDLQDLKEKCK